jgi:hypothetical protein
MEYGERIEPSQSAQSSLFSYHTVMPLVLAAFSKEPFRARVSSSVPTTISGFEPRAQIEF